MEPQDTPAEPARKRGGQPGITRGPYKDAARKQLKDAIKQLDAAIATPMRAEKVADLIIHKTELLTRLIDEEREDKQNAALAECSVLREKAEQDAATIQTLTSRLQDAERRASERLVQVVPDTRVPQLQAELQASKHQITEMVQCVKQELDEDARCRVAVRLVQAHGHNAVSGLVSILGLDAVGVAQALTQRPEEIREAVTQSKRDTPYLCLLRAVYRVTTGKDLKCGRSTIGKDNTGYPKDFLEDFTPSGSLIR